MASNRKYSTLPDLDQGKDLFETPDLTDGNSAAPTRTSGDDDSYWNDDYDNPDSGISGERLRVDQARSRFMPAVVDAQDVDFSDRVNGKRKSYKVTSRRHRVLEDGTEELGDISDEDDAENLARKIARLKREVEEAKAEAAKQRAETGQEQKSGIPGDDDIASLSLVLESLSGLSPSGELSTISSGAVDAKRTEEAVPASSLGEGSATYTVTYAPTYQQTHALAKAADFDRRLVLLEQALGIGSSAAPELDAGGPPRAVLPTLEALGKQIGTLSEASTSSLDSITRRVRMLIQEVEQLEKARKLAKAAEDARLSTVGADGALRGSQQQGQDAAALAQDSEEQITKINALYGTLPTIENLAPLLPPLLDRLRSLRVIHADAATANETLERIERSQSETAAEIKTWREGLDKIEKAMQDADASMGGNMKVIEGWVKELERKAEKLS